MNRLACSAVHVFISGRLCDFCLGRFFFGTASTGFVRSMPASTAWPRADPRTTCTLWTLDLFGLGVTAALAFLERPVLRMAPELWGVAGVVIGVALAWLARLNMWELWGLPVRAEWIGITLTGVALGGIAFGFQQILGLVTALHRKVEDEAATIERTEGLRQVA